MRSEVRRILSRQANCQPRYDLPRPRRTLQRRTKYSSGISKGKRQSRQGGTHPVARAPFPAPVRLCAVCERNEKLSNYVLWQSRCSAKSPKLEA
eukprot:3416588-Pleurochrysis_carterae.AAC.2